MEKKKINKRDTMVMNCRNDYVRLEDFIKELRADNEVRRLYILNLQVWIKYFEVQCKDIDLFVKNPFLIHRKLDEVLLVMEHFSKNEWALLYTTVNRIKQITKNAELIMLQMN